MSTSEHIYAAWSWGSQWAWHLQKKAELSHWQLSSVFSCCLAQSWGHLQPRKNIYCETHLNLELPITEIKILSPSYLTYEKLSLNVRFFPLCLTTPNLFTMQAKPKQQLNSDLGNMRMIWKLVETRMCFLTATNMTFSGISVNILPEQNSRHN